MTDSTSTSRLLTLVFTDLANSTALKTQRGDSAVGELIRRHRELITRIAADCSGRIIDWAGDGCFLTFEVSSAGVLFALRLQQAHSDQPDLPQVRVGIHLGEVTERAGVSGEVRVEGLAVDMAARIGGLARPGQVLMSAAVYHSARQRLGVEALGKPVLWQTHGAYAFKGIDEPLDISEAALEGVAKPLAPDAGEKAQPAGRRTRRHDRGPRWTPRRITFLVIVVVAIIASRFPESGPHRNVPPAAGAPNTDANAAIKSLAVLPLENLSKDPEQDYFSDGMTEALTSELSKIKSVKVISRTSVMKYKGSKLSMPEIAAELGVEGLIEGSVQKYGDEVRITAQLIHGPSDTHRWSQSYTNTMTNVLKLQSEVALAIADAMKVELTSDEQTRIAKAREVNPAAYDAYVRGMLYREVGTREQISKSVQLFEEATRLDDRFAEAWAELAYLYPAALGLEAGDRRVRISKARDASLRALQLDADLPAAQFAQGWLAMNIDWDWDRAEQRLRRAVELDANYVRGRVAYAWYFMLVGKRREAVEQVNAISNLDLQSPFTIRNTALIYARSGQLDKGLDLDTRMMASHPEFSKADTSSGVDLYLMGGKDAGVIELIDRLMESSGRASGPLMISALAHAVIGQSDRARALLSEALEKNTQEEAMPAVATAVEAYAVIGDLDTALRWMEEGYEARSSSLAGLRAWPYSPRYADNPNVVAFRNDPRYHAIIDKMKFPPLPPDHPGYAEEQAWLAKTKAAADATAPITKIAVLPFENISGDETQEYFVDGMTEALISELAKIKSIKVISRTSAMHYKDMSLTLPEIARELCVEGVIEGSAMRAGDKVRITAQLIRSATDDHLWAENYTESLENVLVVQSKVALAIADAVKAAVTPEERGRVASARKVNVAAYDLYVQARRNWSLRTAEGLRLAQEQFSQSIAIDPDFALGHAGLADVYYTQAEYGILPSAEGCRLAREEAEKALALDPDAGEAYATLAMVILAQDYDWAAAEKLCLKARELSPNYATAHHWHAFHLCARRNRPEATEELRLAHQLDPSSPVIGAAFAEALWTTGQTQGAFELAQRFADEYPSNWRVQATLASVNLRAGKYEESLAAVERMIAIDPSRPAAAISKAGVIWKLGRTDEARALLDNASGSELGSRQPTFIAQNYAIMGDRDRAIEWIAKAVDAHDVFVTRIRVFPEFDALESDPRYQALLRRMNFPE